MENIFAFPETVTLIQAIDKLKTPANYLTNTFFSQKLPTANSDFIACEFRRGKRLTAPFIVEGSAGTTIARTNAEAKFYRAPMVAPRRNISVADVNKRIFGEQPVISNLSPEERASQLIAQDLTELVGMIENTKNFMAAKILQSGVCEVNGVADDGEVAKIAQIDYNFTNKKIPQTLWNNPDADILGDLRDCIEKIAESTGTLPTMLLCGKNIEKYLFANKNLEKIFLSPSRDNLLIASIQPKYLSPQTRYIGTITALGLEVYSYFETYYDPATNTTKPFIDDDTAIVISPGIGAQASGAITLIDKNAGLKTYASEYVPCYRIDEFAQQMSLTVYSRFIMIPHDIESWFTILAKGEKNVVQKSAGAGRKANNVGS